MKQRGEIYLVTKDKSILKAQYLTIIEERKYDAYVVKVSDGLNSVLIAAELQKDENVIIAEPDLKYDPARGGQI